MKKIGYRYLSETLIEAQLKASNNIDHGFFGRKGGVSSSPYNTLNCGFGSNDDYDNITQNRDMICGVMKVEPSKLFTLHQTHSSDVILINKENDLWLPHNSPKADAFVTKLPNIMLGILTADCAPVLFCDPIEGVIGAAHSGWRGAIGGILENTILTMEKAGAKKENISVAIGPTISQSVFEIGLEVIEQIKLAPFNTEHLFKKSPNANKAMFDLKSYIGERLRYFDVFNIDISSHCTFIQNAEFFSYRRSKKEALEDYGRQLSVIVIK